MEKSGLFGSRWLYSQIHGSKGHSKQADRGEGSSYLVPAVLDNDMFRAFRKTSSA